jgi:LysR family transcriptional activator of nhaA
MSLNYNHLLYFYTAVNCGSLKSAAEQLSLSPSTISEQVAELENYFGKTLLRRGRGKLSLTDHGQTAYQFARTIFTAGDRLRQSLRADTDVVGTPVEIGVNSSVTELFERSLFLPLFKDEETKIRLRVGELGSLADDLYSFSIDIVITDRELKEGKSIRCEVMYEPQYSIVAKPSLLEKFGQAKREIVDLYKLPFVHYTVYSGVKWELDQWFFRHQIKPTLIGEVDDTGIMKHAVLDGLCYAILPTVVVQKELASGELVSLGEPPDLNVKVYAYYHEKDPTKQIKSVLNYLRGKTKKLSLEA